MGHVVHLPPPYTPVDKIQAQLGYNWSEAEKTHIDVSEFDLLVFVKNGKVVRHFKVSGQIGFQNLEPGNIFSPTNDAFEVKPVIDGTTTRFNFFPKKGVNPEVKGNH